MSSSTSASPAQPPESVDIQIRDGELVAWLRSLSDGERGRVAENALKVGRAVLDATQLSVTPASSLLEEALRPLSSRLSTLQTSLDSMQRATVASQNKGVLGEQLVLEQLRSAFPLDRFEHVGASAHETDVCGDVRVGDATHEVRIEAKLYKNTVPSSEVDKFKRDMLECKAPLGLFVSLSSSIANVKGRMDVQRLGTTQTLVLVPNAGFDGTGVLWGLLLLKALAGVALATDLIDTDAALAAVETGADELRTLAASVLALERSLGSVAESLDAARWKVAQLKTGLVTSEKRILASVRRVVPAADAGAEADAATGFDAKVRPYVEALRSAATEAGAAVRRDGDAYVVESAGTEHCRVSGKRKLNAEFAATGQESIEIGVEDVRGTAVVVNGDAPVVRWGAAVKKRLLVATGKSG